MHIGQGTSPCKMECVFFPPSGYFNSHSPAALQQESIKVTNALGEGFDDTLTANDRHEEQKIRTWRDQEGALYDELEETRPVQWTMALLLSVGTSSIFDSLCLSACVMTAVGQSALPTLWGLRRLSTERRNDRSLIIEKLWDLVV